MAMNSAKRKEMVLALKGSEPSLSSETYGSDFLKALNYYNFENDDKDKKKDKEKKDDKDKKKDKDKDSREKKDPQKDFEGWREDLGPTTTEKDLEKFAEKSEKVAIKRYGKDWNYDSPKPGEQKEFANMIRKGETEIAKRMRVK